jgi:hypothetical protein
MLLFLRRHVSGSRRQIVRGAWLRCNIIGRRSQGLVIFFDDVRPGSSGETFPAQPQFVAPTEAFADSIEG